MGCSTDRPRHSRAAELWRALAPIFSANDGSLPELVITGLAGGAVDAMFECLRRDEKRSFPESQFIWMNALREEVPLSRFEHPARAVAAGTGEPFHCTLVNLSPHGVRLPELGVSVFSDEIRIDYRMGEGWTALTASALIDRVVECMPVGAHLAVWEAWPADIQARAQAAIDAYIPDVSSP
jgi:hypothetical protein